MKALRERGLKIPVSKHLPLLRPCCPAASEGGLTNLVLRKRRLGPNSVTNKVPCQL